MTKAEKAYEAVAGSKPDSETAIAVGLVWAIERAPTLLDKVKAAKEFITKVQEDERAYAFKRYEF